MTDASSTADIIKSWQDLIGAALGVFGSFSLWLATTKFEKHSRRIQGLHYKHRVIEGQINKILELHKTLRDFDSGPIERFLNRDDAKTSNAYLIDSASLPLFATTPFNDSFEVVSSGSGYVDAQISLAYRHSQDLPHFVTDLREQFKSTLESNKELSMQRLNPPDVQKNNYLAHLEEYRKMFRDQALGNALPTMLKALAQTIVAVDRLREIGLIRWKLRYDSKFKFFWSRKSYLADAEGTHDRIDADLAPEVEKLMKKINDQLG